MFYIVDEREDRVVHKGSEYNDILKTYIVLEELYPDALLVIKQYELADALECDGYSNPLTDWDYTSPHP